MKLVTKLTLKKGKAEQIDIGLAVRTPSSYTATSDCRRAGGLEALKITEAHRNISPKRPRSERHAAAVRIGKGWLATP